MWVRCPNCGHWCYAEKAGLFDRLIRSFSNDDKNCQQTFGELGDEYLGMKGVGRFYGRVQNASNILKHGGEMLAGDNYRFYCKCGKEFGTDDESEDLTLEHDIWEKVMNTKKEYSNVVILDKKQKQEYYIRTELLLAEVENCNSIEDAKAVLFDILACCHFYFFNDGKKAITEINQSLSLFDDANSHVLKGLFMGKVSTPLEYYEKMNELLCVNNADSSSPYYNKGYVLNELEECQKKYAELFTSIPANQRKFLVVASDYSYLPKNFKIIKYNDVELGGLCFEGGFPSKDTIYVAHPYKKDSYYPVDSYQLDLFKNQLNELRELLQCLGAKRITTENNYQNEVTINEKDNNSASVGGGYDNVSASISGEDNLSKDDFSKVVKTMLIDDEFSFNDSILPYIPEGLAWFGHMEEWQRLARMRMRGQNRYSISVSSKTTKIIQENEVIQLNAEFDALIAKGKIDGKHSEELKTSSDVNHEWKLIVDFYPLEQYKTILR